MLRYFTHLIHRDNPAAVCKALAWAIRLPLTASSIASFLHKHPDYPSLLSIRDLFDHYGFQTAALHVKPDKFSEIPLPYITQLKQSDTNELYFTVVRKTGISGVTYLHPKNGGWHRLDTNDFLQRWSGVVLIINARSDVETGEFGHRQLRDKEIREDTARWISLAGIPIVLILLILTGPGYLPVRSVLLAGSYALLCVAGALLSLILNWQERGGAHSLTEGFCKGKTTDCKAVLQSPGSKWLGISWSTTGFVFFTGILSGLAMNGAGDPAARMVAGWSTLIALPYALYSVTYQWWVVHRWCRLCLAVQMVLLLEGILVLAGGWLHAGSGPHWPQVILRFILGGLIPFGLITLVIPLQNSLRAGHIAIRQLATLKRDPAIFGRMTAEPEARGQNVEGLGLLLGNQDARHTLIKVCNPYCKHCSESHAAIKALLRSRSDIRVRIIFTGMHELSPVRHFLSVAEHAKGETLNSVLDSWYSGDKNYKRLAHQYPENEAALRRQESKIEAMRKWCASMDIQATPTYFLDGRRLPMPYGINDLEWLFPRGDVQ